MAAGAVPELRLYTDKRGKIRARLVAANSEKILPNESHGSKADVLRAIDTLRDTLNDPRLKIVDNIAKTSRKP